MPPKAKRSSESAKKSDSEAPVNNPTAENNNNNNNTRVEPSVSAEDEREVLLIRLRFENQDLKRKIKNEQTRNDAVIDRVAMLLDSEYRRRRQEERAKAQREEDQMFEAGRRRKRDDGDEADDDDEAKKKKKKSNGKEDKDTTSTERNAAQRKENRWDFDIPDTLPVTRQNLALYNFVQSLKEAQDSGISVFRVLDYIRAGIVPTYGREGGDAGAPPANPRRMPIRTDDGSGQVPMIDDTTEEYYTMVKKQSQRLRLCGNLEDVEERIKKLSDDVQIIATENIRLRALVEKFRREKEEKEKEEKEKEDKQE